MSTLNNSDFNSLHSGTTQSHTLNPDTLNWKGTRFLDPNGKVFETMDKRIFRVIYPHRIEYVKSLFSRGIIDDLVQKELLVPTKVSSVKVEGFPLVLEHDALPYIIWAQDWTRETLKQSALNLIDINIALLPHGMGTIDGHGNNTQQTGAGKPIWIDLGSINPLQEIDGGNGMFDEFFKYFVRPLMLFAHRPALTRTAELLIQGGGVEATEFLEMTGIELHPSGPSREALLNELRQAVSNLKFPPLGTYWEDYYAKRSYDLPKQEADCPRSWGVYKVLETLKPKRLIDLGCNAGLYSFWAAQLGAQVLSIDYDRDALSNLHKALDEISKTKSLSVSVARRNLSLPQNVHNVHTADVAMALAITHHLSLSQHLPFAEIAKILSSYTTEHLLTEFMPNGLGNTKPVPNPLPEYYNLENFMASFEPHFENIEAIHVPIPEGSSHRILVHCSRKRVQN